MYVQYDCTLNMTCYCACLYIVCPSIYLPSLVPSLSDLFQHTREKRGCVEKDQEGWGWGYYLSILWYSAGTTLYYVHTISTINFYCESVLYIYIYVHLKGTAKECIRHCYTLYKNVHKHNASIWYKLTHRIDTVYLGCHDDGVRSHSRPNHGTEGLVGVHRTRSCRGGGGCGRLSWGWGFYRIRNKYAPCLNAYIMYVLYYSIRLRRFWEMLIIWDGEGDKHYEDLSRGNRFKYKCPLPYIPGSNRKLIISCVIVKYWASGSHTKRKWREEG